MYWHLARGHAVQVRSIIYASATHTCMHPKLDGTPMMHLEGTSVFACPRGTFECCECRQTTSITFEQPYGDERDGVAGGLLCKECVSTLSIGDHHLGMPSQMLMEPVDKEMSLLPWCQSITTLRTMKRSIALYQAEDETSQSDDLKHEIRCIAASEIQTVAKGWLVRQRAKREMKAYQRGVQLLLVAMKQQSQSYDSECLFRAITMGRPPYLYPRFPIRAPTAPAPAPPAVSAVPAVSDAPDAPDAPVAAVASVAV
jgi:hypothetical protein